MSRIKTFFASAYLFILLSAPVVLASETHSGDVPPPPPDGGGGSIVWPDKGNLVTQWLSFALSLEGIIPLI
jgi:hypothetical protein